MFRLTTAFTKITLQKNMSLKKIITRLFDVGVTTMSKTLTALLSSDKLINQTHCLLLFPHPLNPL